METHACVHESIFALAYFRHVWADLWGVVPSDILLSAEVGVAPRLLQPADLADEFLHLLNLQGGYLYWVRLVPLGTPQCLRPSQQNICSPLCGSGTVALMENRGELRGLAAGCGIVSASPAPPHGSCYQACQSSAIHSFVCSIQYTEIKEALMKRLWEKRLLEMSRGLISDLVSLFWGSCDVCRLLHKLRFSLFAIWQLCRCHSQCQSSDDAGLSEIVSNKITF